MNSILADLAETMQKQAGTYIPQAYALGKAKGQSKYGTSVPWSDMDNVNVELLLNRHAEELQQAFVGIEQRINEGHSLKDELTKLVKRAASWAWVLSPALAMGLAAYVNTNRQLIAESISTEERQTTEPPVWNKPKQTVEMIEPNDIGVIWLNARDQRVCKRCLYLSGRWFPAKQAYEIAATIHPGCRCPSSFDIGTPDEATVGPIPGYKPGTAQDIYRDLNIDGSIRDSMRRARNASTPRGQVTPPNI